MSYPLIMTFIIIIVFDFLLLSYFMIIGASDDLKKTMQDAVQGRIEGIIRRSFTNPLNELPIVDQVVVRCMKNTLLEELIKEKWLGTKTEDLKVVLQQWGYLVTLHKKLNSRKWWVKLEALHVVSMFDLTSFKPLVKNMLDDDNPFVQAKAFRVLGLLGDIHDLGDMLAIVNLYQNERYRLNLIVTLLENLDIDVKEEHLTYMIKLYEQSRGDLTKQVLIHLIASKFKHKSLHFLRSLLNHPNKELAIAAIKSMVRVNIFPKNELIELLDTSHMGVKIVTLKALAFMKNRNNMEIFERNLLTSENWWLKYYGGFGIAMLGTEGLDKLSELRDSPEALAIAEPFIHYFLQILQEEGYVWETLKRSLESF